MKLSTVYFVVLTLGAVACETPDDRQTSDKGPEDAELAEADGKFDSFYRPTEHGELRFSLGNPATVSDDARFHSWTFTLTKKSKVVLTTEVSTNLDTVMYLYRRKSGDASWGHYVEKNDDYGGNYASRIALEAEAGEYRVIVKPYKLSLRGTLSLAAECDGDGCPGPATSGPFALPADTNYGGSCAARMLDVLSAPITAQNAIDATWPDDRAALSTVEQKAADYYLEYWNDWMGFLPGTGEPNLKLDIAEHGSHGTSIDVDVGADEDRLEFVFDGNDNLVTFLHDEQSPIVYWHCGEPGAPPEADEPDPSCWSRTRGLRHIQSGVQLDGAKGKTSVANALNGDLGSIGGQPATLFASAAGLDPQTEFTYQVTEWENLQNRSGARSTFSYLDKQITYFGVKTNLGTPAQGFLLATRDKIGVTRFVCQEY